MARLTNKTIPAAFQKLDATMSDADEYINVRDLQVARANHNILIARGMRRTVFSRSFGWRAGSANDTLWVVRDGAVGDERLGTRRPMIESQLLIDYAVQSVSVRLVGDVIGTGLDVTFKAVLDRPFGLRDADASGSVTFTQGVTADGTITVPVPLVSEQRRGGIPLYRFSLFMGPEIGASLATNIAVSSAGSNGESVTVATASLSGNTEGRVLHFGNTIPPRICSRRVDSGGNSTLFVAKPFGPIPVAGTDRLDIDEAAKFAPTAVTVYEDHITAFDAARAGI